MDDNTADFNKKVDGILGRVSPDVEEQIRFLVSTGEFVFHIYDYPCEPNPQSSWLRDQFDTRARRELLREIGASAACEAHLRKHGVDDIGMACLRIGDSPHNRQGLFYDGNVDHIEDVASFRDKNAIKNNRDIHPCNRSSNLIYTNKRVNDAKNKLSNEQINSRKFRKKNEGHLPFLTIVPVGHPKHRRAVIISPFETYELKPDDFLQKVFSLQKFIRGRIQMLHTGAIKSAHGHDLLEDAYNGWLSIQHLWDPLHDFFPSGKPRDGIQRSKFAKVEVGYKYIKREAPGIESAIMRRRMEEAERVAHSSDDTLSSRLIRSPRSPSSRHPTRSSEGASSRQATRSSKGRIQSWKNG